MEPDDGLTTEGDSANHEHSREGQVEARAEPDHGHDHDHWVNSPIEAFPGERVELFSVGIDVGSATCQVLLSRIYLERAGLALSSRYEVVRREIVHAEPQIFTPYLADGLIDAAGVTNFVVGGFAAAGASPDDIDTGVVLFTGEAARRDNAEELGAALAARVGNFVCAAAGHEMEGVLAAHGSGAVARAEETGLYVLNVDIGGGTTKLTLAGPDGVDWSCAIAAGGRLAAFDSDRRIIRLEPRGEAMAERAGLAWALGAIVDDEQIDAVGRVMADGVADHLPFAAEPGSAFGDAAITRFPGYTVAVDSLIVSGGVATFVSDVPSEWRSDLGERFGHHLWNRLAASPFADRFECADGQATVLGASEYSVQVSGNTIHLSDSVALPLRNLAIVRPRLELTTDFTVDDVVDAVEAERENIELAKMAGGVALCVGWQGLPLYRRLSTLADGLVRAAESFLDAGEVFTVVLDGDVARLIGALVDERVGTRNPTMVLDGFDLKPFEFIDVGEVLEPAGVVPIAIKSVLFHQM